MADQTSPKRYKTRDARPPPDSMIKPGELIDFVELSPLSLIDRRIYNLLIAHAWDRIDQPVTHVIAKSELRGLHESNDRIGESVERLMAAIIRTYVEVDGKPAIQRAQLLGPTTEARSPDGLLYYGFSTELRAIMRDSRIFARLHREVILHLSSKYSLALYELVQKRGNLDWQHSEEFTVERFRQLLGVDPQHLRLFKHLNERAIQPAVTEVDGLSDFGCKVEPLLAGRKVVKLRLSWWRKNTDQLKATYRELKAAKVGRTARLKGTVEKVVPAPTVIAETPLERRQRLTRRVAEAAAGGPSIKLLEEVSSGVASDFTEILFHEVMAGAPGRTVHIQLPPGTDLSGIVHALARAGGQWMLPGTDGNKPAAPEEVIQVVHGQNTKDD